MPDVQPAQLITISSILISLPMLPFNLLRLAVISICLPSSTAVACWPIHCSVRLLIPQAGLRVHWQVQQCASGHVRVAEGRGTLHRLDVDLAA